MKDYEINVNTSAIIAISDNTSLVYEDTNKFIIECNSTKIIDKNCRFFGSTLEGRKKGTERILGITHKVPIIMEESKNIIFLPTSSTRIKQCDWINLNNIDSYINIDGLTKIVLKNKITIELKISYNSFNNQILRAYRLDSVLSKIKSNL